MRPKQLADIIESVNYIEYDFRILNVDLSTAHLKVEFEIEDTEGSNEHIVITMTSSGNKDFFLAHNDYSGYCNLEKEHPLLWQFQDIQCELYIAGRTDAVKELFHDLFTTAHSLFGQYLSFDPEILRVVNNGNGLFLRGAKKLLKLYADILNQYGIKTSIISERPADKDNYNLKILFLGDSYFISDNFDFEVRN